MAAAYYQMTLAEHLLSVMVPVTFNINTADPEHAGSIFSVLCHSCPQICI